LNESGISWEKVDLYSIADIFHTAVAMNSPEEAGAFYEAVVKFCDENYGGLINKAAWETEQFDSFTEEENNAMTLEQMSEDVGLYFADVQWYRDDGYNVINFLEIYDTGCELEESESPIESLLVV